MKYFDLEKAKAGAPVLTIDGRKARIISFDSRMEIDGTKFPIVALVESEEIGERVKMYTKEGHNDTSYGNSDLVMAPVKCKGWVIIDKGSCFSEIHESKEKAMEFAEREEYDYTAIAHIEWEE